MATPLAWGWPTLSPGGRRTRSIFSRRTRTRSLRTARGGQAALVAQSDREAVSIAVGTLWGVKPETVRMVYIKNTSS